MKGKGPRGRKGPNREKANQAKEVNADFNEVSYLSLANNSSIPFEIKNRQINLVYGLMLCTAVQGLPFYSINVIYTCFKLHWKTYFRLLKVAQKTVPMIGHFVQTSLYHNNHLLSYPQINIY